jgi:bifunctional ADP-heptose synthase (sugar kinase/adenylyltransferase)
MRTFDTMSPQRLGELIDRFGHLRIAVLGDFFLDKYLDIDPSRADVSVETGKTAHQVVTVRHSPGAAGTIVCNLAALGIGTLHSIGFTGDDGEAYDLRKDLTALGCRVDHLVCDPQRMTPVYLKPRDVDNPALDGEHDRYDTKNRTPTSEVLIRKIIAGLDALLPELDAVIIQDQVEDVGHGVVAPIVIEALADRAKRWPKVVFWADSRRRIKLFRNVIIKPNQFEAVGLDNPLPGQHIEPQRLCEAVQQMKNVSGAPICATCGPDGMLVSDPEFTRVPGVRVEGPIDSTGAGDSATAGAVSALAAGATLPEAALVGNLVASITVQQLATTGTAKPEQLPPRLAMWQSQRDASRT